MALTLPCLTLDGLGQHLSYPHTMAARTTTPAPRTTEGTPRFFTIYTVSNAMARLTVNSNGSGHAHRVALLTLCYSQQPVPCACPLPLLHFGADDVPKMDLARLVSTWESRIGIGRGRNDSLEPRLKRSFSNNAAIVTGAVDRQTSCTSRQKVTWTTCSRTAMS